MYLEAKVRAGAAENGGARTGCTPSIRSICSSSTAAEDKTAAKSEANAVDTQRQIGTTDKTDPPSFKYPDSHLIADLFEPAAQPNSGHCNTSNLRKQPATQLETAFIHTDTLQPQSKRG
jgi:hypothetical protein